MVRLINFADANMTISQEKNAISAIKHGAQEVVRWNPGMIDNVFFEMNKDILTQPRGAGYWLWKPYIIYREMLSMQDGDILVYSDAGIEFIASMTHITNKMNEGWDFFMFSNGWRHGDWCKAEVVETICGGFASTAYNAEQIQASLLFFRVNKEMKEFVKEWLLWCQFPGFIDDSKSDVYPNNDTFSEHRHDQAILTSLALKYNYDYFWLWPDRIWQNQRHRWPHSDYPAILIHTRKRNNEY